MRLAEFICEHLDQIQIDWESHAAASLADDMATPALALQAHVKPLLHAIAKDMEAVEEGAGARALGATHAVAVTRAALRDLAGRRLRQVGDEFRALRTAVSCLWYSTNPPATQAAWRDLACFHEILDYTLSEYIAYYSDEVARARDAFLSILGHDLRSPLSAITIASDYLAMPGMLDGKQLQAAVGIKSSAASLSAMIRSLMAFAKTRLGRKMELAPQRSDVGNICEAAVMKARILYPDYAFHAHVRTKVYGEVDPLRLQQVLDNLMEGAVQQGANGQPITLAAYEDEQAVVLCVETCGDSVALDSLQLIVDPAVQVPFDATDLDDKLLGIVGLGLFTAREIVLAHGGHIQVERAEQGGTIFTVRLPHASEWQEEGLPDRRWRFA